MESETKKTYGKSRDNLFKLKKRYFKKLTDR